MGIDGWISQRSGYTDTNLSRDIHGSVIAPAAPARASSYDPFGKPTGANTLVPELGYRGEITIDNLTYLRARNYDAANGVFTSRDPLDGINGTPVVGNAYHYANNNPLTNIDPLGLSTIKDASRQAGQPLGAPTANPPTSTGQAADGGASPVFFDAPSVGAASERFAKATGQSVGNGVIKAVEFVNHQKLGIDFGKPDVQRAAVDLLKAVSVTAARKAMEYVEYGRRPDYVVAEFSGFSQYGGGGGGFVTFTRDGDVYFSPETGIGTPGLAATGRFGWLIQDSVPTSAHLSSFLGGLSFTASANGPTGTPAVALTYGFDGFGAEIGITYVGKPSLSLTESYAFVNHGGGWSWNG